MNSPRHAFALAGLLAATMLTGAAALAGISHRPAGSTGTSRPPVVQIATPAPAPATTWQDD